MDWRPLKAFHPLPKGLAEIKIDAALTPSADGFWLSFRVVGAGFAACVPMLTEAKLTELMLTEQAVPIHGQRRDELWKRTCFEAFFGVRNQAAYYEFNGSPEGDWALYRFDDYRAQMTPVTLSHPPELRRQQWQPLSSGPAASQTAMLLIEWWIPTFSAEALADASITAVVSPWSQRLHSNQGAALECLGASYWALSHAGSAPDFHRRESFVIALEDGCHESYS